MEWIFLIFSRVSVEDFKTNLNAFMKKSGSGTGTGEEGRGDEAVAGAEDESQDLGDDGDTFDMKSLESKGNDNESSTVGKGGAGDQAKDHQTVSTAQDTKTSTGDDFSESILIPPPTAIPKLSPDELQSLREDLQEAFQLLQSDKVDGVYSARCSHHLLHYHALSKRLYQQTQSYLLTEPQHIAEAFLAEYYHTLDHDLKSTRAVSRFYETDSTMNFGGIPDVVSRRKISRALVVGVPPPPLPPH
jgi:hypothetical protein